MTIPAASSAYSCFVRSKHHQRGQDDGRTRDLQASRKNVNAANATDYRPTALNISNLSSVSSLDASSSLSSSSYKSSLVSHPSRYRPQSLSVIFCMTSVCFLLIWSVPAIRAEDAKYSFNGFAGGLILHDSSSSSGSESILTKRSPSEDDAMEELPSPSALRVDDKAMPMMPEISLPTVTVRGFLNLRTTIDGTVIVFTPSSTAAAATASAVSEAATHMQYSSAMYMGNNPFSYKTSTRAAAGATQWSTSYRPTQIHASPVQSPSSAVYPTGVVTVIADTSTGANGIATVQETKVIGTFIDGKYAQILKSSSFVPAQTPVMPSNTLPAYKQEQASKRHEVRRPVFPKNTIHGPRGREKSDAVTRFTRGDRDEDGPTEPTAGSSPVKVRKPIGRLPGSGTGRYTWNRPASERGRLIRPPRVRGSGDTSTPTQSSRFTARDENERVAAKALNRRLTHRLGISRSVPFENRSPAAISAVPSEDKDRGHRDESESNGARSSSSSTGAGGGYETPLLEGMLAQPAGNPAAHMPPDPVPDRKPVVVTDVTTLYSEVTRGFIGGEPLIETITETSTIERTIDPTPAFLHVHPTSESVTLASGMMNMMPDALQPSSSGVGDTPPLPSPFLSPVVVVSKTFTLTESSSRTSLYPSTEGSITTTHTITENLVIRKLITAYKTIPGGEENTALYESIAAEMNNSDYADSLMGAENNMFSGTLDLAITPTSLAAGIRPTDLPLLHPSLNLGPNNNNNNPSSFINANFGPQIDLNNPLVLGAALQNPGLAAMYFGLQQLSQQVTQYTTLYKPTETLSTEVIFATKTLSFYDGRQTRTRTITEPASTTTKLVSTTIQDVQPVINPQVLVQQAQLQRAFASQLLNGQNGNNFNLNSMNLFAPPGQQQQQQQNHFQRQLQAQASQASAFNIPQIQSTLVTDSITTVTTATATSTKIYTLIYNALSTKFRTVTSTSLYPTTVTELVTRTLTPSASFNFFG